VAELTASVRFLPIAGETDQAAGVLFRVQDRDNHYILRANALENNVTFYMFAGGQRVRIGQAGKASVATGEWQSLRVEVRGRVFRGFLNDQEVVTVEDESYEAGGVGLWTKADSETCFDTLRVTAR
jgi:hypothetical protein